MPLGRLFLGYRVSVSIWGNDLRYGRRKQTKASTTVFMLKYYFTASIWDPGETFSDQGSLIERTGALMTDSLGFEFAFFVSELCDPSSVN